MAWSISCERAASVASAALAASSAACRSAAEPAFACSWRTALMRLVSVWSHRSNAAQIGRCLAEQPRDRHDGERQVRRRSRLRRRPGGRRCFRPHGTAALPPRRSPQSRPRTRPGQMPVRPLGSPARLWSPRPEDRQAPSPLGEPRREDLVFLPWEISFREVKSENQFSASAGCRASRPRGRPGQAAGGCRARGDPDSPLRAISPAGPRYRAGHAAVLRAP